MCKGRTNSRPPCGSKTKPLATRSLNEEGARSGPFFIADGDGQAGGISPVSGS